MKETVISLLADILRKGKDELAAKSGEKDVWDSLQKVEIILALESEFDVVLEGEEIASLATIDDIVELLEKKVEV